MPTKPLRTWPACPAPEEASSSTTPQAIHSAIKNAIYNAVAGREQSCTFVDSVTRLTISMVSLSFTWGGGS